jgi:hypothetical protein
LKIGGTPHGSPRYPPRAYWYDVWFALGCGEIVLQHGGLLYGIYTFDDARTALTPAQRQALASLRVISRRGPFPVRPNAALVRALRSRTTIRAKDQEGSSTGHSSRTPHSFHEPS